MEVVEEKQEGKFKQPILNKTKKNGRLAPMQASWPVKVLMLVVAMAVTSSFPAAVHTYLPPSALERVRT